MSNNWFNIPNESALTESNICDFCAADKDECGEYAECCYREVYKKQLTTAYNIVIKYGFCGDCRWVHDSDKCHKYDCYTNAVSVIQEAIRKAYKSEKRDLTFEKVEKLFQWRG